MPLKRCSSDGKSGYKWGDEGKCYTGRDAKKQAIKQGIAIEGPEKFSQKHRNLKCYILMMKISFLNTKICNI